MPWNKNREYWIIIFRPLINNKIEAPTCGDPPSVTTVIAEDPGMIDFKKKFKDILEQSFDAVKEYCKRFLHIYHYYVEDMSLDENEIRENEKCDIFRKWCERYRTEEEEINSVPDVQPLGIFYIQLERFKTSALPAPNKKQQVLAEIMPRY